MSKGSWIKGTERDKIFNMLVAGENHKIIGEQTGHRLEVIDNWSSRHQVEIAAARRERAEKLEQIWLAVQENRLSKIQDRHMELTDRFYDLAEDDEAEEDPTALMLKTSHELSVLERQVGEETGQLPTRSKNFGPDPGPVTWTVDRHDDE